MPAAELTQSAGLCVGAGGGGHRAELGVARVTGALTAESRPRSQERAHGSALPLSGPPPPSADGEQPGRLFPLSKSRCFILISQPSREVVY